MTGGDAQKTRLKSMKSFLLSRSKYVLTVKKINLNENSKKRNMQNNVSHEKLKMDDYNGHT